MKDRFYLSSAAYLEELYLRWKKDPRAVTDQWRWFFEGFDLGVAREAPPAPSAVSEGPEDAVFLLRARELVRRYREFGHLLACLDPLESCPLEHPLLTLESCGLTDADLDRVLPSPVPALGKEASLRDVVRWLRETYCRSVGVEYFHLCDLEERKWLQERMEAVRNRPKFDPSVQLRILERLWLANRFEQFLHKTYLGQKRFSLEGAETLVPMLDALIRHAASSGCSDLVLGMAHRGRLNVQVNVLGKSLEAVFSEFEEACDQESDAGSGDVKYHKGFVGRVDAGNGRRIRTLLLPNPSHLESVDPVVEGFSRALQDRAGRDGPRSVLPVLIHGDSAFAGQGVVYETLNLSQLPGYRTGGTVHVIINNQIGFTTVAEEARSTRYATDVAKMLPAPVFHVHGEDPEAAIHVIRLACDYRYRYAKDVVVDLICYRRYGHNEGDEPYYTQPKMVERIRKRPPVPELYADRLKSEGVLDENALNRLAEETQRRLESALRTVRDAVCGPPEVLPLQEWEGDFPTEDAETKDPKTAVSADRLRAIARAGHALPQGFRLAPKLEKILRRRLERIEQGEALDWSAGEFLAFGSLLTEGVSVRLSGQDSGRGTFSHRHAVLYDVETEDTHVPLNHAAAGQAPFYVFNSSLSEYAVLGFEYGYSLARPKGTLVLWEAQFGDFANNAQVIIDQYLAGAESKWGIRSGLVLLLPHGYEGMGPEHSSARLERFLQLCAEENLRVAYPTTPAQYFHLLRRQALHPVKKPLIVMAPKSLLRRPEAVSSLEEFSEGTFHPVLEDPTVPPGSASRVVFCSGKVFYDLIGGRRETNRKDVAVIRIEELYPFPKAAVEEIVRRYGSVGEYVWAQEEPENMGAWTYVKPRLSELVGRTPEYVGRPEAASPATGFRHRHEEEQMGLVRRALARSDP